MPNTISKLQALFDDKEQLAFIRMMVVTKRAIKAFRDDPALAAESMSAFKVDNSEYMRDRNCEIDFTMLSVTISQAMEKPVKEEMLNQSIAEVAGKIKDLVASLGLFLKTDTDAGRKKVYQDALDYIKKIEICFDSSEHKNDEAARFRM